MGIEIMLRFIYGLDRGRMNGVVMSRLATKVVVAAVLAFTAVTATGCLPTTSVQPPLQPPLGVAAG